MKCPNCAHELVIKNYKGIEVNQCTNCAGMWFDTQEVDQLEDTVFAQDEFKNTMITNVRASKRVCPKCGKQLKTFSYRWQDLELDYCEKGDGFWLDKGEEKRITEIIDQDAKETKRSFDAEKNWTNHLKRLQSPSIVSKIQDILGV